MMFRRVLLESLGSFGLLRRLKNGAEAFLGYLLIVKQLAAMDRDN
jgi:hypothetical protein